MQAASEQKKKETTERPRNPSLVTFDINQFLRVNFQLKLVFGKFGRIVPILRGCRSSSTLIETKHLFQAKQLILGALNTVLLHQGTWENKMHNCIRMIISQISHINNKHKRLQNLLNICICIQVHGARSIQKLKTFLE